MAREQGVFFVLDGPDGSGKSTQARLAAEWLGRAFPDEVTAVRDPGGTAVGEAIRSVLLDVRLEAMTEACEMLLYMASRAQLTREVIRPALEAGRIVVADRFLASTAVYQGLAGGLPMDEILRIGRFATQDTVPDLTLLYDVPLSVGRRRLCGGPDRMEAKEEAFHRKVRQGYRAVGEHLPGRVVRLDGTRPLEEVTGATRREMAAALRAAGRAAPSDRGGP